MSKPADTLLHLHNFVFNSNDNGGEQLSIRTKMFSNGDDKAPNVYWNQEIELQSYCNSASFNLHGLSITPEKLRKLADELEIAERKAQVSNDLPQGLHLVAP
jgi:hypothetical protein